MARQGVTIALQDKGKSWGIDLGRATARSGLQRSEGAYGSAATRLADATREHIEPVRQQCRRNRNVTQYIGRYLYVLEGVAGEMKIRQKRVELDLEGLWDPGTVSILL